MDDAKKILGACIRALREEQSVSLEQLAYKSGISYQHLSGVETGKENFTVKVLERLSSALGLTVKTLILTAYDKATGYSAPLVQDRFFRGQVPLPEGLTVTHLQAAMNQTQAIIHTDGRVLVLPSASARFSWCRSTMRSSTVPLVSSR